MPLERLTALVIRPDGAAVLVVPELERQLALDSAAGQTLETNQVVGWRDGDDPYDLVASILPREGRVAIGDRIWASHVLALQRTAPASRSSRLTDHRPSPRREGPRRAGGTRDAPAAAPTRRSGRSAGCDSWADGRRRSRRTWRHCSWSTGTPAPTSRSSPPVPTPLRREPSPAAGRSYPKDVVVMDFGGEVGGTSPTPREPWWWGRRRRGSRCSRLVQGAGRPAVRTVRPASPHRTSIALRGGSSTPPVTAAVLPPDRQGSGSRSTSRPTSSRGTRRVLTRHDVLGGAGVYLEGRFGVRIEDIVAVTADGVERRIGPRAELQTVD